MSYCDGLIARGLPKGDCSLQPKKGFEKEALLINRADIDWSGVQFDTTHKNVLTALPLLSGKKAFEVYQQGSQPFNGSTSSATVGTYVNTVSKNLVVAILNNDPSVSEEFIDPALNGDFVAIVQCKDKGSDNAGAFKVLGLDNGLTMSAFEADPYGDAFNGGILTLTESDAPTVNIYLGASYAAGKALYDGLKTAAS